jgi:hypothetical protein
MHTDRILTMQAAMISDDPPPPTLIPNVEMTITFISDAKKFAFAARHDNGESVYISPLLAEQTGLDRKSAGRVMTATISANVDEFVGGATSTTPWRVMSWTRQASIPVMVDGAIDDLRTELEELCHLARQVLARAERALTKLP